MWDIVIFMVGMTIGVYSGILSAVHNIKKYPEKWEQFGIIQEAKNHSYSRGYKDGWCDGCDYTFKHIQENSYDKLCQEHAK